MKTSMLVEASCGLSTNSARLIICNTCHYMHTKWKMRICLSAQKLHAVAKIYNCMLKAMISSYWETPWQITEYRLSLWDHTMLLATRHNRTHPTPSNKAGMGFIYPGGMEGW